MSDENRKSAASGNESDNSRNNNGTVGVPGGIEHEPKGSFQELSERVKENNPVNERGIRENEENHTVGDIKYGQGSYAPNETDPNEIQRPDPDKYNDLNR